MFVFILVLAAGNAEPPAIPTGMDLLYGDRLPLRPTGEPNVAIGIADGVSSVELTVEGAQLDFYQGGVLRTAQPRSGAQVKIRVVRSRKAHRRHYVDVEGVKFDAPAALEEAVARWSAAGRTVEVLEEGTAIGVGGRLIDTREYRLVLPAPSVESARELADQLHTETGARAFVKSRIETLPWAALRIDIDQAPIGIATSYARFTPLADGTTTLLTPVAAGAKLQRRAYRGEIYVVVNADGQLSVVNVLGAEQLLRGVVPSELFASAHPQALQAQAVAARNQLFAKLGHRHHADPFHLCSEQHCQVYTGTHREDPRTDRAIQATRGELLFHNEQLVDTVYSSTCGGHTENNETVWGNAPNPALRGRPDFDSERHPELKRYADGLSTGELRPWFSMKPATYCSSASKAIQRKFRWRREFTQAEMDALVAKRFPGTGGVRKLIVQKRGRGGRVETLSIQGAHRKVTLLHELPIRRAFSNLDSGAFTVTHQDNGNFVFIGGGWGHGVGLCQIGSIGRAEAGHDYRSILRHYYNGAAIIRVYGGG